jgi:hypothetical protein
MVYPAAMATLTDDEHIVLLAKIHRTAAFRLALITA